MLSSFQRFHNNKEMKPSPGSYNDPRSALEVTKRTTGLKRSPFGQTAVRFQPESHVKKTPGKKQKCILQLNLYCLHGNKTIKLIQLNYKMLTYGSLIHSS